MSSRQETITIGDVRLEIPPAERSPLVEQLLHMILQQQQEIEGLREEIRRLKGLPDLPKRPQQPSTLNDPQGKPSRKDKKKKKRKRGKRPGSSKRKKNLKIDATKELQLDGLPEGSKLHGYEDYFVQDLVIRAHNIRYRRARYKLPDGSSGRGPRCRRMSTRTLGLGCAVMCFITSG